MKARAAAAPLLLWLCAAAGCYYEIDPLFVADQGIDDLGLDLARVDLEGDGPRCPGGALALHAGELSEGPIDRWGAEPLTPLNASPPTTTVVLDPARKSAGAASLRLDTRNGQAGLFYPKTRDASFDLSPYLYLSFSITADNAALANDPGWQGAQPHLLLVTDTNDYYEYVPLELRLPRSPGDLLGVTVPLSGGMGWTRNKLGAPDLSHVRYLALLFDSWGAGFTVWVDDLQFGPKLFLDCP